MKNFDFKEGEFVINKGKQVLRVIKVGSMMVTLRFIKIDKRIGEMMYMPLDGIFFDSKIDSDYNIDRLLSPKTHPEYFL